MKTPRIILEWDCDGIGCTRTVQIEVPADQSVPYLTDREMQRVAEGGGLPAAWPFDLLLPAMRESEPARA